MTTWNGLEARPGGLLHMCTARRSTRWMARGLVVLALCSACGCGSDPQTPSAGAPGESSGAEVPAVASTPPLLTPPPVANTENVESASIHAEEITYEVDGKRFQGYLAYDDHHQEPRPGVLVVHEWWGHTEYARKRARMLAEMGYVALALDMFGEGKVANHPTDAKAYTAEVLADVASSEQRFVTAAELLRNHPRVDGTQLAAIGYCFGGGVVLHAARRDLAGLRAVASFHGGLDSLHKPEPGSVKAKIVVFTGDADPMVPPDAVAAFESEMQEAQADVRIVHFANAKHSFTNPEASALGEKFNMPLQYDAAADAESWAELERFFGTVFAAPGEVASE